MSCRKTNDKGHSTCARRKLTERKLFQVLGAMRRHVTLFSRPWFFERSRLSVTCIAAKGCGGSDRRRISFPASSLLLSISSLSLSLSLSLFRGLHSRVSSSPRGDVFFRARPVSEVTGSSLLSENWPLKWCRAWRKLTQGARGRESKRERGLVLAWASSCIDAQPDELIALDRARIARAKWQRNVARI